MVYSMVMVMTDCNNCKHENECNHSERYDYTYDRIIDYQTDKEYNSNKDISELLNWQDEQIQDLKTRNKRQYELLKKIGDLMLKKDWETLGLIVDEWEKEEERIGHLW